MLHTPSASKPTAGIHVVPPHHIGETAHTHTCTRMHSQNIMCGVVSLARLQHCPGQQLGVGSGERVCYHSQRV